MIEHIAYSNVLTTAAGNLLNSAGSQFLADCPNLSGQGMSGAESVMASVCAATDPASVASLGSCMTSLAGFAANAVTAGYGFATDNTVATVTGVLGMIGSVGPVLGSCQLPASPAVPDPYGLGPTGYGP